MEIDESRAPLTVDAVPGTALVLVPSAPTVDALVASLDGAATGSVAVCEQVSAGLGAVPHVPAGAALWTAVVVDVSGADEQRRGWLPLVATLAAVDALRAAARVPAEVTWPDGLTVPGAMCGGDAGTRALGAVAVAPHGEGSVVVTVGILVSLGMLELPKRTTSVYADGGTIDRAAILAAYLPALERRLDEWRTGDESLERAYRDRCQTLGRLVEVDGVQGRVRGVDERGRLLVALDGEVRAVAADEPAPALV